MGDASDWPALLADYRLAIEEFDRLSLALLNALGDRTFDPDDFPALHAAEARARDAVVLHRMRLMNRWREIEGTVGVPPSQHDEAEKPRPN